MWTRNGIGKLRVVFVNYCGIAAGRGSGAVAGPSGDQDGGYQGGAEDANPEGELTGEVDDVAGGDEVVDGPPDEWTEGEKPQ